MNPIVPKNKPTARESRRNFLKTKLGGGLIGLFGWPLLTNAANPNSDQTQSEKPLLKDGDAIDWSAVRTHFNIREDFTFFNTASGGVSSSDALESMNDAFIAASEVAGIRHHTLEAVRPNIASFFNVKENEIVITRNTTEGMNIVARTLNLAAGDEVLLTTHEHVGGSAMWLMLQKEIGIKVKLVDLDMQGHDNFRRIKKQITDKTKVVSFSHVTCTTGTCLPAKKIADYCRRKGIYSCIDGAQSAGLIPVDLADIQPDFYATSGHKWLYGPLGTGILFMNEKVMSECKPVFVGAYSDSSFNLKNLEIEFHQLAHREEYGTRSAPMAIGLSKSIDFLSEIGMDNVREYTMKLATNLRKQLNDIPGVEVLSPVDKKYATSIVTFKIKNTDSLEMRQKMWQENCIRVRHIYEADLDALRVSVAIFHTQADIDLLVERLKSHLKE